MGRMRGRGPQMGPVGVSRHLPAQRMFAHVTEKVGVLWDRLGAENKHILEGMHSGVPSGEITHRFPPAHLTVLHVSLAEIYLSIILPRKIEEKYKNSRLLTHLGCPFFISQIIPLLQSILAQVISAMQVGARSRSSQ